ncbi:hypothetical protein [Prochlorococcus marinus]|uniref:hypothetical protein n=1 Tax=Prochlorococcus marinus TaxID=1219 RepID=UPI0022B4C5FA|nr:hypothetical protein [Prochlorococcus marinus]
MVWRIPFTVLALYSGLFFSDFSSIALANPFNSKGSAENYRVLSKEDIGLGITALEKIIKEGDELFLRNDLVKAKKKFDDAITMSNLLLNFYADLRNSFRGLDARIPREMNNNSREVTKLLSKARVSLAALFRKDNKPAMAVPLLVDVVRVSSASSLEGQQAYQALVDLGFVNTPYRGAQKRP